MGTKGRTAAFALLDVEAGKTGVFAFFASGAADVGGVDGEGEGAEMEESVEMHDERKVEKCFGKL